jgi:hypothetical protein
MGRKMPPEWRGKPLYCGGGEKQSYVLVNKSKALLQYSILTMIYINKRHNLLELT